MKKIIHFDTSNANALSIQRVQTAIDGKDQADEVGISIKENGKPEVLASLTVDEAHKLIKGIEEIAGEISPNYALKKAFRDKESYNPNL